MIAIRQIDKETINIKLSVRYGFEHFSNLLTQIRVGLNLVTAAVHSLQQYIDTLCVQKHNILSEYLSKRSRDWPSKYTFRSHTSNDFLIEVNFVLQ